MNAAVRFRAAALLWAGWLLAGAVQAEIYRCPQPGGGVAYQQRACSQGTMLELAVDAPDAAQQAAAERRLQREVHAADTARRERLRAEQAAAALGPAGIRHAAADAARGSAAANGAKDRGRDARSPRSDRRSAASGRERTPRVVVLRAPRAGLAR